MTQYAARPRRRRGGLTLLLVFVLVLGAIAVVGDRAAAAVAERELRTQVAQELAARQVAYHTLDVSVGGVPFLTQVARGHYDHIAIDLTGVQLPPEAGKGATLPSLQVVGSGVDADARQLLAGNATVVASQVTGTGVMSYPTLDSLVDLTPYHVSGVHFSDADGALQATGTVGVAGVNVPITAVADVAIQDGQIQVRLRDAKAVGVQMPQVAKNYLDELVARSITARLPRLPFDVALDRLAVAGDGLRITVTGRNVRLAAGLA